MSLDNKGISVIICCYNSANRLPATIKHLALQQVANDINWELIVINNNSNDNTKETAALEINKYESLIPRYTIIDEPTPGLSSARHKGIQVSKYEYITFCDDDNWLDKNYLSIVYQILEQDPKIGAVGGRSKAVSDVEIPKWFTQYEKCYAVGIQRAETGILKHYECLWGAGFAFRKSAYSLAYKNHPSLLSDRNGNELSSGGDYEICLRMQLMKFKLYYDENLTFKHFIPKNRLTDTYLEKLLDGLSKSNEIMTAYYIKVKVEHLSFFQKVILLQISCSKYLLSKFSIKRWNSHYENLVVFNITGGSFEKLNPIERKIKSLVL